MSVPTQKMELPLLLLLTTGLVLAQKKIYIILNIKKVSLSFHPSLIRQLSCDDSLVTVAAVHWYATEDEKKTEREHLHNASQTHYAISLVFQLTHVEQSWGTPLLWSVFYGHLYKSKCIGKIILSHKNLSFLHCFHRLQCWIKPCDLHKEFCLNE